MSLNQRKELLIRYFMADGFDEKTIKIYKFKENPFERGDEKLGVTAQHKTARNHATGQPKKAYYIEGNPYEMGYLLGFMAEPEISRMTSEFVDNKLTEFLSEQITDDKKRKSIETILKFVLDWYISLKVLKDIPSIYDRELQGIVEGCQRAKRNTRVNKGRLWMLNVGFDCLLSVAYTGKFLGMDLSEAIKKEVDKAEREDEIQDDLSFSRNELRAVQKEAPVVIEPENLRIPIMCNGFSAFGEATLNNNHLFGRDFMFGSGGVYQDTACMIIYNPEQSMETGEESLPFVSMTAPGIIGSITIMNSKGVAAGVDMAPGANCNPDKPGMNSLMLLRHAVQHAATARDAVRIMEKTTRGVSWNYIISDGTNDEACIVESGASTNYRDIDFLQYPAESVKQYLPSKKFLREHPSTQQHNGLMVRWHDFQYPTAFYGQFNEKLFELMGKVLQIASFGLIGYINNYDPGANQLDHNCPQAFYFAPQRECSQNVVVVSNHFILPEMRLCSMNPWTNGISKSLLDDIQWRYDELNKQIMDVLDNGGKIDYEKARELIDFLSPKRKYPKYYEKNPKSQDGETVINGSVSLCDLKNLTMESHYGYYCDEWVKINLARFKNL